MTLDSGLQFGPPCSQSHVRRIQKNLRGTMLFCVVSKSCANRNEITLDLQTEQGQWRPALRPSVAVVALAGSVYRRRWTETESSIRAPLNRRRCPTSPCRRSARSPAKKTVAAPQRTTCKREQNISHSVADLQGAEPSPAPLLGDGLRLPLAVHVS